ncbi:hypothetical protein MLD38_028916 [Melastoma candidum]|uniref:Uncharacterized protein n=1 Tax=Melastoma candidum TaxID=119954 RepID=A0ACB9N487_9MYRT|nr:hypothetical protein MLD38_028916 [Melastoma candidum]
MEQRQLWVRSLQSSLTNHGTAVQQHGCRLHRLEGCVERSREGQAFDDGTPLPAETILDCLNILEEESVAILWRKGDVLLLDHWAALHCRRSFEPPRWVLASLCK